MIVLYNIVIFTALIFASPFLFFKSLFNKRLRYKIKDRFLPSMTVKDNEYMLFHAASFGEMKAILNIVELFKDEFYKKAVFSVFTDTGYKLLRNQQVFIMPVDLYFLYKRIFAQPPKISFFFETEIWPSYITFLHKRGSKLVLLNGRMSKRSFKMYKRFAFLFRSVIRKFDVVIAKSEEDALRFKFFSNRVVVCDNIKKFKTLKNISIGERLNIRKKLNIHTDRKIVVFGSVHKEEIQELNSILKRISSKFYCIVAPRHIEEVPLIETYFKKEHLEYSKRSELSKESENILILDSMGELEDAYKLSDVVVVCGSMHSGLKGHNPIEPVSYNKFVICGQYMESFAKETDELKRVNLLQQCLSADDVADKIEAYCENPVEIDASCYFSKLTDIVECNISNIRSKMSEK